MPRGKAVKEMNIIRKLNFGLSPNGKATDSDSIFDRFWEVAETSGNRREASNIKVLRRQTKNYFKVF